MRVELLGVEDGTHCCAGIVPAPAGTFKWNVLRSKYSVPTFLSVASILDKGM